MKTISPLCLLVHIGLALVLAAIPMTPAAADITVDPDSVGATDVVQDPAGTPVTITNPVSDPLDTIVTDLAIGNTAAGALEVDGGSMIYCASGYVGKEAGSTGTVVVDGSGTSWNMEGFLRVGDYGTGTLTIQNGGAVYSLPLTTEYTASGIGEFGGAVGSVLVDGAGSVWEDGTDRVDIGSDGVGTLTIQNGGAVVAAGPVVVDPYATGSKIVFNNGTLTSQAVFSAGSSLEGTGTISTKGWCFDTDLVVAQASDLQHQVVLNDLPGQNVTVDIDLSTGEGRIGIAYNGTASMTIQNGMTLNSNRGYVAYRAGSVGMATVTGAGSTWNDTSDYFQVGFQGDGTLLVEKGGLVTTTGWTVISSQSDSIGNVTVEGSGSQFSTTNVCVIGSSSNSSGNITINGTGAKFTCDQIQPGLDGNASINIINGGTLESVSSWLGIYGDAEGTITVQGPGSKWTDDNYVVVGNEGSGTIVINDGGLVEVATDAVFGNAPGGLGTLEIGIGDNGAGLLTCNNLLLGLGSIEEEGDSALLVTVDTTTLPTVGTQYTIAQFTLLDGTFLNEPTGTMAGGFLIDWNVLYNTNDITLEVASITAMAVEGDFDENGVVDSADLAIWQGNLGMTTGAAHTDGDADEDGDVDGADFLVWQQQVGQGSASSLASQAVPEPSTILLGVLFLAIGLVIRGRR